ncbi:hypothetical protein ACFQHV_01080 [Promicromonospora thailandica]|uniref:Uncharacterized protein n=1 Tax=Promicromonospora thailandica TaxID=765201 RepID=A0A9X2G4I0_9MICO|nr:hypothetical protein [Promicromonospora thailandica]MCP2265553.1 hypothetical protein [Promicromonospora thailandica]BFF17118.1 hypothetical protein GCM10025730_06390 [Promicromonospora thailandica]
MADTATPETPETPAVPDLDSLEFVGRLTYPGDVRQAEPMVYHSPRHGVVAPIVATYDSVDDKTVLEFMKVEFR